MFKKGDYVVYKDVAHEYGIFPTSLFEVTRKFKNWNYLEIKETKCWHHNRKRWGSYGDDIRHATPEEIAAGHRIDTNTGVTVITTSGTSKVKGGLTAFIDMGDDSHIENHVSPNCKKFDERVR